MINFRVDELDRMLARVEASGTGRFGWVMVPDGNKVEMWQPAPEPTA